MQPEGLPGRHDRGQRSVHLRTHLTLACDWQAVAAPNQNNTTKQDAHADSISTPASICRSYWTTVLASPLRRHELAVLRGLPSAWPDPPPFDNLTANDLEHHLHLRHTPDSSRSQLSLAPATATASATAHCRVLTSPPPAPAPALALHPRSKPASHPQASATASSPHDLPFARP